MFGDEMGMVETAFANVAVDGGERNDGGESAGSRKSCV